VPAFPGGFSVRMHGTGARQVRHEREKRFAHGVLRKTMGVVGAPNLLMIVVSQLAVLLESQPQPQPQAAHFSSA